MLQRLQTKLTSIDSLKQGIQKHVITLDLRQQLPKILQSDTAVMQKISGKTL